MNFIEHHGHEVIDMGARNWPYEDGRETYSLEGIEKADVLIDLGACFGGFTLMASEVFKKQIIAVEPVWFDVFQINMEKNRIDCGFYPFAIANPKDEKGWALMNWDGRELYARKSTFKGVTKSTVGKKVFLKCDIEMGEWNLQPEDFADVIRCEIEIHNLTGKCSGTYSDEVDKAELIRFFEKTYYIDADDRTVTTQNGTAKVFHLYRKDTFPEKANVGGPISKFLGV